MKQLLLILVADDGCQQDIGTDLTDLDFSDPEQVRALVEELEAARDGILEDEPE